MGNYLDLDNLDRELVENEIELCIELGIDQYRRSSPTLIRKSTSYFLLRNGIRLPIRAIVKRAIHAATGVHGPVNSKVAYDKIKSLGFDVEYIPTGSIDVTTKRIEKRARRVEKRQSYESTSWFRNEAAAREAKERAEYCCEACGLDFEEKYGALGEKYLEAHHKEPLALKKSDAANIAPEDLLALCANCHRMIHRLIAKDGKPWKVVSLKTLQSNIQRDPE